MTGQLRPTLDARAGDHDLSLDLDAVLRAGDRRIRRRRAAVAGGTAAMVAVALGIAALGARHRAPDVPPATGAHDTTWPLSYAVGSVIHDGSTKVDVGVPVWSLVRSADGFVFSTPDDQVMAEQDGRVRAIGHLADASTSLVAADDGHLVGWWDGERFQLWPGRDGHTDSVDVGSHVGGPQPNVVAISDDHVWMWNGSQTWVADKPSSDAVYRRYADSDVAPVQDAAAGRLLVRIGSGMAVVDEPGAGMPSDLSQVHAQVSDVGTGDLAPDGRHWFTADGGDSDRFQVFDSRTGEQQQTFRYDGDRVTPYAWLGPDTVAAWTMADPSGTTPVTLVTCRLSTDACTLAASEIGTWGSIAVSGLPVR